MELKINDIHSMNGIGLHEGKLPVDRLELIKLINTWGRLYSFITNNKIEIKKQKSLDM